MKIILILILCVLIFLLASLVWSPFIKIELEEGYENQDDNENKNILTKEKFNGQIDYLTYSKFEPECCPSPYTTSHGCLCYDNNEDELIITRGNNRQFTKTDCDIKSKVCRRESKEKRGISDSE